MKSSRLTQVRRFFYCRTSFIGWNRVVSWSYWGLAFAEVTGLLQVQNGTQDGYEARAVPDKKIEDHSLIWNDRMA